MRTASNRRNHTGDLLRLEVDGHGDIHEIEVPGKPTRDEQVGPSLDTCLFEAALYPVCLVTTKDLRQLETAFAPGPHHIQAPLGELALVHLRH